MISRTSKVLRWRTATEPARGSRLVTLKSMVAFVVDQVLLFWPPYQGERHCDCPQRDESTDPEQSAELDARPGRTSSRSRRA